MIRLNESQRLQIIGIFSSGVASATHHLQILVSPVNRIYYHGIIVTRLMAKKRRRHCIKMIKDALKGIIY